MSRLVVDASVVVDALVAEDAERVQDGIRGRRMVAPAHLDAEVLNALRGLRRGRHLSPRRCAEAAVDLADLPLERWQAEPAMLVRVLDLADAMTAYDALYVVLADVVDAPLLTRDRRLAKAAERLIAVEIL
ncbi:MAG: type II toxin-antitoxin system VapC family toxin [Austwickia sp.]|nr:type II toxin-antitoxin system VapC family toxin [Austwickia sp.]